MPDLAPELLNWFDEHLPAGPDYRLRESRAWTRWPHRYRQRIEVGEAQRDHDAPTTRLVATTPLVRDVRDLDVALEMAVGSNRVASLSAVVVDEAARTVGLACAASIRPGNQAWLLQVLGEVAKLQIAVPELGDPEAMAEGFTGVPDLDPHPTSGPRAEPQAGMAVVEAYQLAGIETGRTSHGMYAAAVGHLHAMGIPSTVDGTFLAVGADTFNLGGEARITVENETHPGFGNGLLAVLRAAGAPAATRPAWAVNELNRRELWERIDGQSFGAWSYDEAGLGHLVFYPNRLIPGGESERRARIINSVIDEVRRLQWLDQVWGAIAAGQTA
ncbi:MAG: hypothetical protein U0838_15110 [Chloroflexota bacterium]